MCVQKYLLIIENDLMHLPLRRLPGCRLAKAQLLSELVLDFWFHPARLGKRN